MIEVDGRDPQVIIKLVDLAYLHRLAHIVELDGWHLELPLLNIYLKRGPLLVLV